MHARAGLGRRQVGSTGPAATRQETAGSVQSNRRSAAEARAIRGEFLFRFFLSSALHGRCCCSTTSSAVLSLCALQSEICAILFEYLFYLIFLSIYYDLFYYLR